MTQRLNISLEEDVIQMAKDLERLKRKTSFSALLSDLVVEEWERRHGPLSAANPGPVVAALNDAPPAQPSGSQGERAADDYAKGTLRTQPRGTPKYPPTPRPKRSAS